ncbi:50S ribosomal protein L4 [Streptomyces sp. SAI-218]
MSTIDILSPSGDTAGTVELPAEIFDVEKVSIPLIHQVVVAQLAAARQGTHKTKTRGEVRGGGKKPYRQKGTGRARQGSTRAPQFAGGGVVHGPVPRDYSQRTPKKMKAAALRHALTDRARHNRIHVVSGVVEGATPSTKAAKSLFGKISERKNLLLVVDRADEAAWLSARNLPQVHILEPGQAEHVRRSRLGRRGLHPGRLRVLRVRPEGQRHRRERGLMATRHPSIASKAAKAAKAARVAKARRHAAEGKNTVVTPASKAFTDPRDVLLKPVVSEKSYALLDEGKYTFIVAPGANKTQIKQAVQAVFSVKVTGVNTINRQGKRKRTRTGFGKRADSKRAIVTLAEGDRIDIFGGPTA